MKEDSTHLIGRTAPPHTCFDVPAALWPFPLRLFVVVVSQLWPVGKKCRCASLWILPCYCCSFYTLTFNRHASVKTDGNLWQVSLTLSLSLSLSRLVTDGTRSGPFVSILLLFFFAGFFFFPVFRVDNIYLYLFLSLYLYIYIWFPGVDYSRSRCGFFFRRSFVPLFFSCVFALFFFRDDGDSHQSRRLLRFPNSLVSSSQPPTIHSFRSGSCPRDLLIRLVVLPFCFG